MTDRRRPRTGPHKRAQFTIMVDRNLHARIEDAATRAGLATGAWIREVLEDTLALESVDELMGGNN